MGGRLVTGVLQRMFGDMAEYPEVQDQTEQHERRGRQFGSAIGSSPALYRPDLGHWGVCLETGNSLGLTPTTTAPIEWYCIIFDCANAS